MQPPGEAKRAAEPGGRHGRPGSRGERPRGHVPARRDRHRGSDQGHGQSEPECQDPPHLPRIRPEPAEPPDRRNPGQPLHGVSARVAGDAEQIGQPHDRHGDPPCRRSGLGELSGNCPNAGEDGGDPGEPETEGNRAAKRKTYAGQPGGEQQCNEDPRPNCHHQGRGQLGMTPDDSGPQQLTSPGLFLFSGVADHGEDCHQGDEYRTQDPRSPCDQATKARVVEGAQHGGERRARDHGGGERLTRCLVGIEVDERVGCDHRNPRQDHHPDAETEALSTQDEADQLPGAGQRAHCAASSSS